MVEMLGKAGEDGAKAFGRGLGAIADHSKTAQDALRGLTDAQSNAALTAEKLALAQMRYTTAAVNTHSTATQLAQAHYAVSAAQLSHERAAQSLTDAQNRLNATHQGAVGYLAAHSASLGEWAVAAGAAATAAGGLVFALAHVGETFEEINRGLELTNNSTGAAMEELKSHADALVGTVDTATNQIGSDMGVMASRLSMEPGAALDQLTEHVGMLRDRFGQLDTPALTSGFREFHVEAAQTNDALASLTQTAIGAGVNVGTVVTQLAAGGTTLAEAGLNYQQAAYLIAQADKDIGDGGAQKAVTGIEMGMKDAVKHGMDFQTYIRDIMYSLSEFRRQGETQKFDALAEQAFGTRKWAEVQAIFADYNKALAATNQQLAAAPGYMDELDKKTRNLDNVFHEIRNHLEAALQPPAENAVDVVGDKAKELMAWIDAHREDIRNLFTTGLDAAEKLLQYIADIAGWFAKYPGMIETVAGVFVAWKSIEGVAALITSLQTIDALLKGLPASAALAGAGITVGLAPAIAAVTELLALLNLHGSAPDSTRDTANDKQIAGNLYAKQHGDQMPPGYMQWLNGNGPMPPELAPFYHPGQGWPTTPTQVMPPWQPGPGQPTMVWVPGQGYVSTGPHAPGPAPGGTGAPGESATPGSPGGPPQLIEPDDPNKPKKGPRLPQAPEVPYGAGYGAPPEIGETERHYAARQNLVEQQHQLAEDQARLDQLEKDANANQADIQKVKNKILTDRGNIIKAEGDLYATEERSLKRHGDALAEMGAKIDNDFGISKGLPGIAENLTKFLANLAFSPVFGALKGADAAYGGDTHGGKGVIGMIALGAGMGNTGGPSGPGGWNGMNFGGAAMPGLGGAYGGGGAPGFFGRQNGLPGAFANLTAGGGAPGPGAVGATPQLESFIAGGLNLSTIPVAAQKYANDCIDASARIILSHSGVNMTEDQLEGVIGPGGSIQSQAAGLNQLDPAGGFVPMAGSGGNPAAMFDAIKRSIDNGTGSILNVAPGSALAGRTFADGHFIAVTGYNPDGTINVSDTAGGRQYSVSPSDAFQATRGRGIVAGTGSGPPPPSPGGGPRQGTPWWRPAPTPGMPLLGSPSQFDRNLGGPGVPSLGLPGMAAGGATPPSPLPQGAVPIIAHQNEHVLTSDDVNAMGGQGAVYAMREQLHAGEGQPGGGPQAPRAGAPAPAVQQPHTGGPGPSLIGGMAPSPGWGSGFQVTGGGLVGLAESLPAQAIEAGIAAAEMGAFYGGAIEDLPRYEDGGAVGGGGGGPAGGSPGGSTISALINIGMQELNEGISKGAQAAGALVGGLQQTFGPEQFAQSKQAQTGWITKLIGGFMGAQPQLPNTAGGKGATPGLSPEQAASQHMAAMSVGGDTDNSGQNHGVVINGDIHTTQPAEQFASGLHAGYTAAVNAQMGGR